MQHTLSFALLLLLTGCMTTTHRMLVEATFPKTEDVVVFEFMNEVRKPYVCIARIAVRAHPLKSFSDVREAAKAQARRIGANALVVESEVPYSGALGHVHEQRFVALRWK